MGIYKQFVYVYVRAPLLFELVLVLSVSAQRLVCVGSKTNWNYGRRSQRSRPGTHHGVYCVQVSVCIGGLMKRARQGGRCARIIRRVMEGVHEEFRLALRENKWEGRKSEERRGEWKATWEQKPPSMSPSTHRSGLSFWKGAADRVWCDVVSGCE